MMKTFFRVSAMTTILLLCFIIQALAYQEGEINKSFKNVNEIKIKTVSGDCIIKKGDANEVKVVLTYTYDDYDFEPEFEQKDGRLILTERFSSRHHLRGKSTWRLTVPEKTDIDFSTASGDLDVEGLNSTVEAGTASGNVQLQNMTGEFDISTASGEVEAQSVNGQIQFSTASGDVVMNDISGNSKISTASGRIKASAVVGEIRLSTASGSIHLLNSSGEFEISAASGNVDAEGVVVQAKSSFSAASGDVEVALSKSPAHDLKLSSASGDAVLNFNHNPINGFIEMTAKAERGRIKAPFKFDDEEYYYKWDDEYVRKTVRKGSDRPRIKISTASGKAILLEH
ncbi:MAG: DUF4097 domain-containing protein [bacterium]